MYLALWLIRRCRLPATPAFSLPDAVILKRFLAPDFVFSFGISYRAYKAPSSGRVDEPPWHAFWPGGSEGAGYYANGGRKARRTRQSLPCHPGFAAGEDRDPTRNNSERGARQQL